MRKVAITNQKGGSGKTTTAVNLAGALAEQGSRVLVVDLDPQGNASRWLGRPSDGREMLDVLAGDKTLSDIIVPTNVVGVDVAPGGAWLATAERALAAEVGAELGLKESLGRVPSTWDYVLVDTPPTLGLLTISALVACGEVLAPVEASSLAVVGLGDLLKTVERVRTRLNPELRLLGVFATRVDSRTKISREIIDLLQGRFGPDALATTVRESVRFREAPSHQSWMGSYDAHGTGHRDYRSLAIEVQHRSVA
ncbi:MAG: ParA family protein [Sandaracinaceae bacterium]